MITRDLKITADKYSNLTKEVEWIVEHSNNYAENEYKSNLTACKCQAGPACGCQGTKCIKNSTDLEKRNV